MHSIKVKVSLSFLCIIVLLAVTTTYLTFLNSEKVLMDQQSDHLTSSTSDEAIGLAEKFDHALSVVKSGATDNEIANYNKDLINTELKNNLIKDFLTSMSVADIDGTVTDSSDPTLIGKNFADKPFFKKAAAGEQSEYKSIDFQNRVVNFYVFSPVKNTAGGIVRVIFGEVDTNALFANLTATTLQDIGDLVVVDKEGMVLYSTDEADNFKSLWTLNSAEKKDIQTKYGDANATIDSMQYEIVKDKIASYSGPNIFDFFCKEDKEEELMTVAQAGSYPLFLTTEFDKENMEDIAMKNIIVNLIIVFTIASLISLLVGYLLISHFLKPLKALTRAVESIGRGNLDQKIVVNSNDEFRELADTIENMATELRKSDIIKEARTQHKPETDKDK